MIKKIVLIVVGVVVVAIVAILGIAATKPDRMHVERSTSINATPEAVFPHINNMKKSVAWSPWEELDPKMQRAFKGPEEGVGARYEWKGNDEVGEGSLEITESRPPSQVKLNLHFITPFAGDSVVIYNIEPEASGTKVTWSMDGENAFMCKVMQVFMNVEEMCGQQFDKGLSKLKTIVESSKVDSSNTDTNAETDSSSEPVGGNEGEANMTEEQGSSTSTPGEDSP